MPIIISGTSGISGVDGTAASPAIQGTDGDTGVYFPAANQVALTAGGTQALLGTSTGVTIAGTLRANGVASDIYPLVQGAAVASTSGTSIDFTAIPSWVRRVTVMLSGVSTNGTSNGLIQLGTSGGVVTTGYAGAGAFGPAYSVSNYTTGFGMPIFSAATVVVEGAVTITNLTGNTWTAAGTVSRSDAAVSGTTAGRIALSGTLDRIRLTTVAGTDTFDAGTVNILWE
jgi:hypothetical protein